MFFFITLDIKVPIPYPVIVSVTIQIYRCDKKLKKSFLFKLHFFTSYGRKVKQKCKNLRHFYFNYKRFLKGTTG